MPQTTPDKKVLGPMLWMILLSVLLFWVPLVGPLIAGFVGGRQAGDVGHGLLAALLPAVILGVIVALILTAFELPIIGVLAGLALIVFIIVEEAGLFVGAAVGGATA